MNGKNIFMAVVAVIVVVGSFLGGMTVGNNTPGGSIVPGVGKSYESGYAAGKNDAKKLLEESGVLPPSPAVVNTLSGSVKSVDGNKIIITVNGRVSMNPFDEQGSAERTVVVSDKTDLKVQVPMSPDEQAAAMKKFQEEMKAGKIVTPPTPFTEEKISTDAIKIGMIITVTSDDNIKTASTINASKIVFAAIPSTVPAIPSTTPTKN